MDRQTKILVVEDFHVIRKKEIQVLNELGFQDIVEAEDGETAIRMLKDHKDIGLIISDWNMPEMSGMELLEHIMSNFSDRKIPFIMATAQGESILMDKALRAGAVGFLVKPFGPGELAAVIRRISEGENSHFPKPELKYPAKTDSGKVVLRMAHIQITDHLALGMLKQLIAEGELAPEHFRLETVCMPGWNPVRDGLEKKTMDGAFILAPIAMDLFSMGVPIRLVLFAHKNGSTCVRRPSDNRTSLHEAIRKKIFFIPHLLSIHHMMAEMFLREIGLKLGPVGGKDADVFYEVVPPVNMPAYMRDNPDVGGFIVAEPIGSSAVAESIGQKMFLSGELWENHPCCVVIFQKSFIDAHPEAVAEFTKMLIHSGRVLHENPARSARLAIDFLDPDRSMGLDAGLLEKILTEPAGLKTDDMIPVIPDLEKIWRYMNETMGIGRPLDFSEFVDLRFAKDTGDRLISRPSRFMDPAHMVTRIINSRMADPLPEKEPFRVTEMNESISFHVSSEMKRVDRVVAETLRFLKKMGYDHFSEFKLVLRELLLNAIEHGNLNRPEQTVSCRIAVVKENFFKITVKDQGSGFNYKRLDMAIPDDARQLRRRGYALIKNFSEKIRFNEKGNEVTVYIELEKETRFPVRQEGGLQIISPTGDITAAVAENLRTILNDLVEKGHTRFRFDFEKVQDMDSVSLSIFVVLDKILAEKSPDLEIVNICEELVNLFRMTHLDETYRLSM